MGLKEFVDLCIIIPYFSLTLSSNVCCMFNRYIQVGNAVLVPVIRVLCCELELVMQKQCGNSPVVVLREEFPQSLMAACK